jgi:ethanolaminephosphotransferase
LITGQLFLGVFSGPVEGILIIVGIFAITGWKGSSALSRGSGRHLMTVQGPSFWDTGILDATGLIHVSGLSKIVPNMALNESFMVFGAVGLLFNISTSYGNVLRAKQAAKQPTIAPLVGLLPFVAFSAQNALWLWLSEKSEGSSILDSAAFLPFACAWGLQFAHAVGRMILAHITKTPFPMFDAVTFVSIAGAADFALPLLLNRYAVSARYPYFV